MVTEAVNFDPKNEQFLFITRCATYKTSAKNSSTHTTDIIKATSRTDAMDDILLKT